MLGIVHALSIDDHDAPPKNEMPMVRASLSKYSSSTRLLVVVFVKILRAPLK
jgi:hypothetical protein